MTCITADGASHFDSRLVRGKSLGAFERSVTLFPTQCTVLILLQGSVQERQFSELCLFVNIFIIVDDHQHILNHLCCRIDTLLPISRHHHMKRFIISLHHLSISPTPRSLLHTSLSPNSNLTPCLAFHFFLGFAPWTNDQSNKIVRRMVLHRYINLPRPLPIEQRWSDGRRSIPTRSQFKYFFKGILPETGKAFPPPNRPRILSFPIRSVNGRWRR